MNQHIARRSLYFVLAAAGSLAALDAGAAPAGAKPDRPGGFEVTIVNDCPKAVDARFVVVEPGIEDKAATAKVKRAPVVKLKPHSRSVRTMVPYERLYVLRKDGEMSAGFLNKEDGAGATIRIDESCEGISDTKAP